MERWGMWGVAAVIVLIGGGALTWAAQSREPARMPREPRASAPGLDALGRDSQAILPRELAPVFLGMKMTALEAARPRAKRNTAADELGFVVLDEPLPSGARAVYAFEAGALKLARVQIARELTLEGIEPRLRELTGRYGTASGAWDCPEARDRLPTRRFTWTRGQVGVLDAYLLLGQRVATTLVVAPTGTIRDLLARSHCVPTPPEQLSRFPVPAPRRAAGAVHP